MDNEDLRKEALAPLAAAEAEVAAAESALEELLKTLKVQPRTEKVRITEVLETAFTRLRTARTELAKLHAVVARA